MTDLWLEQVVVGLVDGEPKCCKSFLALDLAVAVAPAPPACVATRLSVLDRFCSTPPRTPCTSCAAASGASAPPPPARLAS